MPGWVRDHSVMRMGIVLKETDTLIGYCHIDHRTEDMSAWLSINIGEKAVRGCSTQAMNGFQPHGMYMYSR